MWGKCANAGQTCVAPDYILVPEEAQDTVIQALKEAFVLAGITLKPLALIAGYNPQS
jgi:acyl-CoA reductase-like NAD-dependent aldehyde dehydrogenase